MELQPHSPLRDYVKDIETAAQRCAKLSGQMLAYSGKGKFVIESVKLDKIVDGIRSLIEVSATKKAALSCPLLKWHRPLRASA